MKNILSALIIIVNFCCSSCNSNEKIDDGMITKSSIDKAYIGMEIKELKIAYSNCNFSEIPLYEFGIDSENTGLLIKKKNKPILFVWTMQGDSTIAGIFCLTDEFETGNKIKVGLSVKDLLVLYPNCSLSRDCLEMAQEYTELKDIGVTVEFVTNEENRVGKYRNDDCNEETKILDTKRKIDRIEIRKMTE